MISCCNGCIPPERNGYCHATCEKYLAEKEAHEKQKAELDKDRRINSAIYIDRRNKVEKAKRKRKAFKK